MRGVSLVYVVVVFGLFNDRPANAVLPVITALRVISFGLDVCSFLSSKIEKGEDDVQSTSAPFEYDRIINRISERIKSSKDDVIRKMELETHISALSNVDQTVKQLLDDMRNVISAKSKETREIIGTRFRKDYGIHRTKIYTIKSLLTFSVPGISNTLLSNIAKYFECGMTSLEIFQNYYMTLVSDVVALALLNEELSENNLFNETLADWKNAIKSLSEDFEKQKDTCKAEFSELIKKDIEDTTDPSQMYENNKLRYPYKAIDVLFLNGTCCIWYRKNYDTILKMKQDKMVFAIINTEDNFVADRNKGQYLKIALKAKFNNCISDTDKILSYLDVLGDDLILWLMFPQDRAAEFKILLHENSTAIKINSSVDGINYTTVLYVRAQDESAHSNFTSTDFDIAFYEDVHAGDGSDRNEKRHGDNYIWIIGTSITVIVVIVLLIVIVYCCYRRRNCHVTLNCCPRRKSQKFEIGAEAALAQYRDDLENQEDL